MAEPGDGTTTTVEILLDGVPKLPPACVTDFSDDVVIETRERNVLGEARTKRNQIVRGFSGSLTMQDTGRQLAEFASQYYTLVDAGQAPNVSILETTRYPDTGQTTTRQWFGVTIDSFPRSFSGSSNTTVQTPWKAERMVTT